MKLWFPAQDFNQKILRILVFQVLHVNYRKQKTKTKQKTVIEMVYMNLSDFINENTGDKIWKELKLITPF